MVEVSLKLTEEDAHDLKDITSKDKIRLAVEDAIKFTLMHDKDSVQEALKQ